MKKAKKTIEEVKVGDIFWACWGYDQTNNDFYAVVSKSASGKSVRVVQVEPEILDVEHYNADDRRIRYNLKKVTPAKKSFFINDQKKGDQKKLLDCSDVPSICIASYGVYANLIDPDEIIADETRR